MLCSAVLDGPAQPAAAAAPAGELLRRFSAGSAVQAAVGQLTPAPGFTLLPSAAWLRTTLWATAGASGAWHPAAAAAAAPPVACRVGPAVAVVCAAVTPVGCSSCGCCCCSCLMLICAVGMCCCCCCCCWDGCS
jgi:hypothetical protein